MDSILVDSIAKYAESSAQQLGPPGLEQRIKDFAADGAVKQAKSQEEAYALIEKRLKFPIMEASLEIRIEIYKQIILNIIDSFKPPVCRNCFYSIGRHHNWQEQQPKNLSYSQCSFQYRGYPTFFKDDCRARQLPLIYVSEHEAPDKGPTGLPPGYPFYGYPWPPQPATFSSILSDPLFTSSQQLRREALETLITQTAWVLDGWKVRSLFTGLHDEVTDSIHTVVFDMEFMPPSDTLLGDTSSSDGSGLPMFLGVHPQAELCKQAWQKMCKLRGLRHLELIITNWMFDMDEFPWEEEECPECVREIWPFDELCQIKGLRTLTLRGRCAVRYEPASSSHHVPARTIERLVRFAKWLGATAAGLEDWAEGAPGFKPVYLANERMEIIKLPVIYDNHDRPPFPIQPYGRGGKVKGKNRRALPKKSVLRQWCRSLRSVSDAVRERIGYIWAYVQGSQPRDLAR